MVPDIQAMLAGLVEDSAGARSPVSAGGSVASVSRLFVVGDDRTSRRRVTAFEATLGRAYPIRGWAVEQWLRSPDPAAPISGLRSCHLIVRWAHVTGSPVPAAASAR